VVRLGLVVRRAPCRSCPAGPLWATAGILPGPRVRAAARWLLGSLAVATHPTGAVPNTLGHPPDLYCLAAAKDRGRFCSCLLDSANRSTRLVGIAGGRLCRPSQGLCGPRDVHAGSTTNIRGSPTRRRTLRPRLQISLRRGANSPRDSAIVEARRRDAEGSANQAKSTLLATVSHEIRAGRLNGVLGMEFEVLNARRCRSSSATALGTVRIFVIGAASGSSNDILDFFQDQAGSTNLEASNSPLWKLLFLRGVAETLAPQAAAKGLKVAAYVGGRCAGRVGTAIRAAACKQDPVQPFGQTP